MQEGDVTIKDMVGFYIRIGDANRAKKDLAQLSSKDKFSALQIISQSQASREFKVEIAKYFLYDLDMRVRRKSEIIMEDLVPGWVVDPAENILKVLKSADLKGTATRNAAVHFLFGIVDANSLRDTLLSLLNSKNRAHMNDIIDIIETYIDASENESEQVKIFEACLDIVLSDDAEFSVKHHASNLLSVFFKKVKTTQLGETLKRKYIEKQVEKAESVYRYLCSGASGLTTTYLEDLLRPINDGGKTYQIKMLSYFAFLFEKIREGKEIDNVIDTYPDYWSSEEQGREEKILKIKRMILKAGEELWDANSDQETRVAIMRIRYCDTEGKMELLEQIRKKTDSTEPLSDSAREKLAVMLHCFLAPSEPDSLKLQAVNILLFASKAEWHRLSALNFLKNHVLARNLNYSEKASIAAAISKLTDTESISGNCSEIADLVFFMTAPEHFDTEEKQKVILGYLRKIIEGKELPDKNYGEKLAEAIILFRDKFVTSEKLKKASSYLEHKLKNPYDTPAREKSDGC